jgi:hypothetical protein
VILLEEEDRKSGSEWRDRRDAAMQQEVVFLTF